MRRVSVATTIMPGYDHVSGLERLRGPVTVIRRCEDLAELISVARSGLADAVLVAGDTEQLTRTAIDALTGGRSGDRPVAVVALSAVAGERERLSGLGVPVSAPEVEARELAALLLEATTRSVPEPTAVTSSRPETAPSPDGRADGRAEVADPAPDRTSRARADVDPDVVPGRESDVGTVRAGASARPTEGPCAPDDFAGSPGDTPGPDVEAVGDSRVTAVWGPAGAPGRTTVAVNLAVELALAGRRTLLLDLDTYAAAAGVHLGLLEESAGIAQACRLAERDGVTAAGLDRAAVGVRVAGATLQVLTGLTRSDRWPELRRAAVEEVLAAAAAGWDEVVLDCGFCLEQDEELSFDVPAPQRNAATLAGLDAADRVIAVGTGDPVGLPRLIRGLDELDRHLASAGAAGAEPAGGSVVEVVVNQVRAEVSGVAPRTQIGSVVERFGGDRTVVAYLPWDRRSLDRALLGGQVLAEAAPSSALRRALAELVRIPGGAAAPGSRRRRSGAGHRLGRVLRRG